MSAHEVNEAIGYVRNDDVDEFSPIETLADIAGALRRAQNPRVAGRHLEAAVQAAGLAAELARQSAALLGEHAAVDSLEQEIADADARQAAAQERPVGSALRPAYGPAFFESAAEKVEELLRAYARGLRGGNALDLTAGALRALKAEAIGLAGEIAFAVGNERRT